MLEYENAHFDWFEKIKEFKYFLQSLLLNFCSRILFSCRRFETSSDLLCIVQHFELFPILMLVFFFFAFFIVMLE